MVGYIKGGYNGEYGNQDAECLSGGGGGYNPDGLNESELCAEINITVADIMTWAELPFSETDECIDCFTDIAVLAADFADIVQNGLNCTNGLAAFGDALAAVLPGFPAVFGPMARGARNPIIIEALRRGRAAHAALREQLRNSGIPGHLAEVVLGGSKLRADGIIIDHANRVVRLIELKPNTDRARALGARQLEAYANELRNLTSISSQGQTHGIAGYNIITELRTYTPW